MSSPLKSYVATPASRLLRRGGRERARLDRLTRLPNRRAIEAQLRRDLARARVTGRFVALHVVGVDRLAHVNDAYGMDAGDALLAVLAARLAAALPPTATIARLGGDEFAVAQLDGADAEDARELAAALMQAAASPIEAGGGRHHVTCSVGVACFPDHAGDADTLLQAASVALHAAKAAGRAGMRVFDAPLAARCRERSFMEEALHDALRDGQFVVHYQPRVDVMSGRPLGVEALVRWAHPTCGSIPPADFIPIAEANRLIIPLGAWVLQEACRQGKAWLDAGLPPLVMAVNLSAVQFRDQGLVEQVRRALDHSGLPAHLLELELTENLTLGDPELAVARLQALRGLGVRLAIDDFGTGYSSLSYLRNLPLDVLKIDRAFVSDCPDDDHATALLGGIVGLGRSLGLEVLAEGVEHPEQLALLRRLGCNTYQGFLYAAPLAADALLPALVPGASSPSP